MNCIFICSIKCFSMNFKKIYVKNQKMGKTKFYLAENKRGI